MEFCIEWWKDFLDVLGSIAVIIASGAAIWGIDSWRKELKGKKEHDLAEEVLALFYQAKDNIATIRSPFGSTGEGKTRKSSKKESEEQKQALDNAYVVYERYERYREAFNRIHATRYRFMALFGKDKVKPFVELSNIVQEIFMAANMLGTYFWKLNARGYGDSKKEEKFIADMREQEAVFWAMGDDDKIAPRVEEVIKDIEKICEPILRK